MSDSLRIMALFPPPPPTTERGKLLYAVLRLRALRSWITPGCYAWWRFTDDIKASQRRLVEFRREARP